jgi:hypothetical protein
MMSRLRRRGRCEPVLFREIRVFRGPPRGAALRGKSLCVLRVLLRLKRFQNFV